VYIHVGYTYDIFECILRLEALRNYRLIFAKQIKNPGVSAYKIMHAQVQSTCLVKSELEKYKNIIKIGYHYP